MLRLLFEKKGNAVWISHLDLMRLFQRAFQRAGLPLTHTQGFNPRPSVSIALPLSVGTESGCELLDFALDNGTYTLEEIKTRLNSCLVSGVRVLDVYENGKKLRDLAFLHCTVTLEYDHGIPAGGWEAISELFTRDSLSVPKRTKNEMQEQDIIPMIRNLTVRQLDSCTLLLDAVVCCQNPTLNPAQLVTAIELHAPQWKPDFSRCARNEIYDMKETIFR